MTVKDVENLKEIIQKRCGIPGDLLTGGTPAEVLEQAKAAIGYRHGERSARDAFADWLAGHPDRAETLREIETEFIEDTCAYPQVRDGSVDHMAPTPEYHPDPKTSFIDWFNAQ